MSIFRFKLKRFAKYTSFFFSPQHKGFIMFIFRTLWKPMRHSVALITTTTCVFRATSFLRVECRGRNLRTSQSGDSAVEPKRSRRCFRRVLLLLVSAAETPKHKTQEAKLNSCHHSQHFFLFFHQPV